MAEKKVFIASNEGYYSEKIITYTYYSGFAVSQKQKCIRSLHEAIRAEFPDKEILEVSTKSTDETGVKLSAFNLEFFHDTMQNPFCEVFWTP